MKHLALASCCLVAILAASEARAEVEESPEHFALSFGVGMYHPNPGSSDFEAFYAGDNGPLLNLELDFLIYRIPYIGPIGLGIAAGWARYKGAACALGTSGTCDPGTTVTDQTELNLFPVAPLVILRVDSLVEYTPVPLVFVGKIGYDSIFFNEKVGAGKATGRTHGFRWGLQVALELNSIKPKRANALDHDWGINSSYLFFELIGSKANSRAQLGDRLGWTAGLGLTF